MGELRDEKPARRPPRLRTLTDIEAPSVKKERVNGRDRYSIIDAKPGVITIYSDDENDSAIKREGSQIPPRVVGYNRPLSRPRIKQEPSPDGNGRQQSHGQTSPVAVASGARQNQAREPLCRRRSHGRSGPPSASSSSSDSSGSDDSDASESEDESDSSSESSSSDESSSGDEAGASAYRPPTPASSIPPSTPQSRRKKEAGIPTASSNPVTASPSRRSLHNTASLAPGHTPVDFVIDVRTGPLPSRSEQAGRSRSQASSTVVPTGAQADRSAQSSHQRPGKGSPVLLGFMPINRGSPPPSNAPREPRAMRCGDARPAGTPSRAPSRAPQRPSGPIRESVSGPSSLPFRGPPPVKDKSRQDNSRQDSSKKDKQRRGPVRPGRLMQTIEQQPAELLNARSQPQSGPSSSPLRPATPGPSSRRTAPPQPSPGIFVTPRAGSVWPFPVLGSQYSPQSGSRSRRKRTFDATEGADSSLKAAELERMLERMRNHEKEMEQQRAQLEDTKRLLAEQKTRIDGLEQRRRAAEPVRDHGVQTRTEERDVAPPPEAAPQGVAVPPAAVPRNVAPPLEVVPRDSAPPPVAIPPHLALRRNSRQPSEARDGRKRRKASRVARIRLREQERQQLEQEREDDLESERQLEEEQRRAAERLQRAARRSQNNSNPAPARARPETPAEAQERIQHEVFSRPLSGLNPNIVFDDGDRDYVSEATGFLMRVSQQFVLSKLKKLVAGRNFFDVAHPGSVHMGCWVVSWGRSACDRRMKLTESGEQHGFSFPRLAVRLWHGEDSIYRLVEHNKHPLKAVHTCHIEACMRPEHIVIEPSDAAAERHKCGREGWCPGHVYVHKDGTRQARRPCIFPPQNAFLKR